MSNILLTGFFVTCNLKFRTTIRIAVSLYETAEVSQSTAQKASSLVD